MQDHTSYLRQAITVANAAREHGNHPFGAILVNSAGELLLSAENTVVSDNDPTAHAELNLLRHASVKYSSAALADCTLYSSSEPCPMCASATVWSNIRSLVFGLGMDALYQQFGDTGDAPTLKMPSREIFKLAPWPVKVSGPLLEEEAIASHANFWQTP